VISRNHKEKITGDNPMSADEYFLTFFFFAYPAGFLLGIIRCSGNTERVIPGAFFYMDLSLAKNIP
jgi:hypothetical protein